MKALSVWTGGWGAYERWFRNNFVWNCTGRIISHCCILMGVPQYFSALSARHKLQCCFYMQWLGGGWSMQRHGPCWCYISVPRYTFTILLFSVDALFRQCTRTCGPSWNAWRNAWHNAWRNSDRITSQYVAQNLCYYDYHNGGFVGKWNVRS